MSLESMLRGLDLTKNVQNDAVVEEKCKTISKYYRGMLKNATMKIIHTEVPSFTAEETEAFSVLLEKVHCYLEDHTEELTANMKEHIAVVRNCAGAGHKDKQKIVAALFALNNFCKTHHLLADS